MKFNSNFKDNNLRKTDEQFKQTVEKYSKGNYTVNEKYKGYLKYYDFISTDDGEVYNTTYQYFRQKCRETFE